MMMSKQTAPSPTRILNRLIDTSRVMDLSSGRYKIRATCKTEPWLQIECDHPRDALLAVHDAIKDRYPEEFAAKAPRLTPEKLDALIVSEDYYQFPNTTMIVCALTLTNGFIAVGESRPIDDETFVEKIGKKFARENARNKIWALQGYHLRSILSQKD